MLTLSLGILEFMEKLDSVVLSSDLYWLFGGRKMNSVLYIFLCLLAIVNAVYSL